MKKKCNEAFWGVYNLRIHDQQTLSQILYLLRFRFYFPLFWGMVMYDNEFKTKAMKFKPRIKLNHDTLVVILVLESKGL